MNNNTFSKASLMDVQRTNNRNKVSASAPISKLDASPSKEELEAFRKARPVWYNNHPGKVHPSDVSLIGREIKPIIKREAKPVSPPVISKQELSDAKYIDRKDTSDRAKHEHKLQREIAEQVYRSTAIEGKITLPKLDFPNHPKIKLLNQRNYISDVQKPVRLVKPKKVLPPVVDNRGKYVGLEAKDVVFTPNPKPEVPLPFEFPPPESEYVHKDGPVVGGKVKIHNNSAHYLQKYGKKLPPKVYADLKGKAESGVVDLTYVPPQPQPIVLTHYLPNLIHTPMGDVKDIQSLIRQYADKEKCKSAYDKGMDLLMFHPFDDFLNYLDVRKKTVTWRFTVDDAIVVPPKPKFVPTKKLVGPNLSLFEEAEIARAKVLAKKEKTARRAVDKNRKDRQDRRNLMRENRKKDMVLTNQGLFEKTVPREDFEEATQFLAKLALFMEGLHGASTWRSMLAQTLSYWLNFKDTNIYFYIKAKINSLIFTHGEEKHDSDYKHQAGLSDWKDFFTESVDVLMKSDLMSVFIKLLSSISIFGLCSACGLGGSESEWSQRLNYFTELMWQPKHKGVQTFFEKLFDGLIIISNRMQDVILYRDIGYLFGTRMKASTWLKTCSAITSSGICVHEVITKKTQKVFDENLPSGVYGNVTKIMNRAEAKIVLTDLNTLYSGIKLSTSDLTTLTSLAKQYSLNQSKLREWELWIVNGSARPQPLGFILTGGSGIGKSTFTTLLHSAIASKEGLVSDTSSMFYYSPANFQTYNDSQHTCVFDDIDTNPNDKTQNHVDVVIKYMNTKPFNIEASGVEDKGQFWAKFLVGIYSSNNPLCNLRGFTTTPVAFWRRFRYSIDLIPNPKFCCEIGDNGLRTLDTKKITNEDVPCLWEEIIISEFHYPTYNHKLPYDVAPYQVVAKFKQVNPEDKILSQALNYLALNAHSYISKQLSIVGDDRGGLCSECNLPICDHNDGMECCDSLEKFLLLSPQADIILTLNQQRFQNAVFYITPILIYFHKILCSWMYFLYSLFSVTTPVVVYFQDYVYAYARRCLVDSVYQTGKNLMLPTVSTGFIYFVITLLIEKRRNLELERMIRNQGNVVPNEYLFPANDKFRRIPTERTVRSTNPGYNPESFMKLVSSCFVNLNYNGMKLSGVQIGRGFILCPRHLFCSTKSPIRCGLIDYGGTLTVTKLMERAEIKDIKPRLIELPERDLVMVFVPEIVTVDYIYKRLGETQAVEDYSPDDSFLLKSDGTFINGSVQAARLRGNVVINNYLWRGSFPTVDGDCGSLVIGVSGNVCTVLGMHVGLFENAKMSIAEDIEGALMKAKISNYHLVLPVKSQVSPDLELQSTRGTLDFTDLPLNSNLGVVLAKPDPISAVVYGTATGYHNTRFSSNVVDMPFAEMWDPLIEEFSGEKGEMVKPIAKGFMGEDGYWVTPYTVNLDGASNIGGDINKWEKSYLDFVEPVVNLVGLSQVSPMSLHEAMAGVPGTVIGSLDMNTSAGPPFNCPKNRVMEVSKDREFAVSPDLMAQIDDMLEIVDVQDSMFSPVANHVLKDEPISLKKQEAGKIRVFNVLSASFNILLKQYFGPISALMRRHPYCFESAIGMDVTSYQWGQLFDWLNVFPNWGAADNSFFDVKQSSIEWLYVVKVIMHIAGLCSYDERSLRILRNLLGSCSYVTRNIQGDYFQTSHMMPTGFWLTIFANGIRNSLQRRYAYFSLRPIDCTDTFRESVRQMVLGDDNIMTTNKVWFNQQAIQHVVKEFGAVLTSASKSSVIEKFDTAQTVSFLKRSFVIRDGVMFAPIEIKTLIKMGCKRVKSKNISDRDQVMGIYCNILSEAFMHGPEMFDRFYELVHSIGKLKGFVLPTMKYDDYLTLHKENKLSVWERNFADEEMRLQRMPVYTWMEIAHRDENGHYPIDGFPLLVRVGPRPRRRGVPYWGIFLEFMGIFMPLIGYKILFVCGMYACLYVTINAGLQALFFCIKRGWIQ